MKKVIEEKTQSGDISRLKSETLGPYSIYLYTDRRDENGARISFVSEDEEGNETEEFEREETPFLTKIYFRKNHVTPNFVAKLKADVENYKDDPLAFAMSQLESFVVSWDMHDGKDPILPTVASMTEHDVPGEVIYSVRNKFYEVVNPKKASSERSLNTSAQKE